MKVPIRIFTERKAEKERRAAASDDNLMFENAVLQQILFEHLYSTPGSTPGRRSFSTQQDKHRELLLSKRLTPNSYADDDTDDDEFTDENESTVEGDSALEDSADLSESLNADSIQKVFQNMIEMTALSSDHLSEKMQETEEKEITKALNLNRVPILNRPRLVERGHVIVNPKKVNSKPSKVNIIRSPIILPVCRPTSNSPALAKTSTKTSKSFNQQRGNSRKMKQEIDSKTKKLADRSKKSDEPMKPTLVDKEAWHSINRYIEAEREMDSLLKYTCSLLVTKWGEYLAMTEKQIHELELKNAKEIGMVEEVVDMLEDTDRYVWEIIEDLVV